MKPSPERIEFVSTDFNNAGGAIISVITAGIALLYRFGKIAPDDGWDWLRYVGLAALILLGILLVLYRKKIIVTVAGPSLHIEQGFWPFIRSKPATLAFASDLKIFTFSTQQGSRGYIATLNYSDGRHLRLLKTLAASELQSVRRLADLIGIKIEVPGSLNYSPDDPAWLALGLEAQNQSY